MSAQECIQMFYNFSNDSFQKRLGLNIPLVKYIVETRHRGQYRSKGLNSSLKKALGDDVMFGDAINQSDGQQPVKLGVTMTGMLGTAYLVTNYNRPSKIVDEGDYYYSYF